MRQHSKKWLILCLIMTCWIGLSWTNGSTASAAGTGPLLGVNDEMLNSDSIQPLIENGKLYVPVVPLSKKMGITFVNNGGSLQFTTQNGTLSLKQGSGDTFERGGRTMVPLRAMSDAFGYVISIPANGVYRIQNSESALTDGQFKAKYASEIQKHAQAVAAASKPAKTSKPAGNTSSPAKGGKTIYLTFDDGPTAHTSQLLDILDKYHAKATFFMLGPGIQRNQAVVKRTVESGHGLGLHGMTHQEKKMYASPSSALQEMTQDQAILYKATGKKATLIRTPYGSKPYLKAAYRDKLMGNGFHLWDWNVDSNDWRYTKNPEHFVKSVLKDVAALKKQGRTPVVLMHDKESTIRVLPEIMAALQKEGYSFEPLTDKLTPLNFWNDHR